MLAQALLAGTGEYRQGVPTVSPETISEAAAASSTSGLRLPWRRR